MGGDHDYHNIHQMWNEYGEEVLVAFICPVANENWLNPSSVQNIGGHMNGHLRWLRDHSDQQKICIYGDDWEKVAGVADWWDNTAEYDSNISWVSSQGWVDKIHVSEAAQWWGVDQSPVNITIPYAAYSYLHSWTGGNYDFWYDDSVIQWGKESVVATAAVDCGGAADRNGNGVSGDFEDLWKTAVENLRLVSDIPMPDPVVDMLGGHPYPSQTAGIVTALCENSCVVPDYDNDYGNPLARAGWVTLTSLLYELGWHDGGGPFMSGWQKNLINHTRYANAFARGAYWHDYRPSTARAVALDIDGDGIDEMLLENDRIAVYFDRRGGRALFMFDSEGRVIAGNVLSNWGGEGDWDDGGHRGLFHDDMGWNSWFDYSIDVAGGPMARVTLNEVYDNQGSPSTDVVKTLTLRSGSSAIQVDISSDYQNWTRFGVTPDLLSNLSSGYDLLPIQGASDFGLVYGGYRCNSSGAAAAILLHGDDDLTLEMESRASSVAEQMRAGGRSGEYTLWAYGGSGTPSIPGFPLDGRLDDVAIWEVDDGEGHFLRVSFDSETGDLYVATNGAGGAETADHFIFVSDAPGAATAAPWAKSGTVPDWDLYLADENDSGYEAWFDANAGIYAQANSRAGVVLEGAFDLDGEMGSIPPVVYVAAAGFGNDDGGELLWQVPAGDGDGNIDVGELGEYAYLAVRLIPDAASFPRGGQLGYDAVLVNEHMTGTVVDLAVQARLPNGSAYPAQPRVIWGGQELDPGESALSFSHNIPGFAPLGSYRFDATLAPSGGDPVAEDSFAFDVTP
ncbi:MAG: hypothetical protein CME06_17950 [Gemmatimonadetes bacterium]|nr:hypothetical protein [Gemmatimonadota bacterium]